VSGRPCAKGAVTAFSPRRIEQRETKMEEIASKKGKNKDFS